MERRKFIKNAALSSSFIAAGLPSFNINSGKSASDMFVGTPVLPEVLYERGIEESLDAMQELSGINTVMTFTHDHVFRQYRQNFTTKTDHEGNDLTNVWVRTDQPVMQGKDMKAKYSDRDILDELEAAAKPRNMKVYGRILEPYVITGAIPGFEEYAEIDGYGNKGKNVCYNHPEYIAYWENIIDELVRKHPGMDGFKFGQERGGPILASLGKDTPGTCFCEHCQKIAKERDINIERARKGMIAMQEFGNNINAGEKPVDGNFVTFMRILFTYPDVLAWEQLWMDSRSEQRKRMYKQIKKLNEDVQVGWHIDHGMTWDLFFRATWDYSKMGPHSDWLSVAVYFDSMGRRSMGHYERNYKDMLFGDASEEHAYPMYLSMLGFDPEMEPPLQQHREHDTSFSSDYVYRECKRAVERVNGSALVYARPGFDMPGYDCNVTPEEVYLAVTKALDAGVDGLWVGREWDELQPANAEAFGNAIRDYKS